MLLAASVFWPTDDTSQSLLRVLASDRDAACCNAHRRLLPCRLVLAKYMAPFVLWEAAVLIIVALSFSSLQGARDAIVANYTGWRVVFRSSRVRLYCNRLVFAETPQEVSLQGDMLLQVCSEACCDAVS